jgi:hypothetical protein
MAADSLFVRRGDASGVTASVVRLVDRRSGASDWQEWAFQREVEAALYGNGFAEQTGAVYRLLKRSGVQGRTLPLKKSCIGQGLVTQDEFELLRRHLGDAVRSLTLIPLDALGSALSVYGREERSVALVAALGMKLPDGWQEEAEAEEDEDEEDEDDDEEEDGGDDEADSDEVSVTATEVMEERLEDEDFCSDAEAGEAVASPPAAHRASDHTPKRVKVAELEVSPALTRQLDAMNAHRAVALNVERSGGCVASTTRESDRARILRFIKWMNNTLTFKSPPTLTIFAHSRIGPVAHQYIRELIEKHERKYSYAAKMAASFVIAAKFVASRRTATTATDDTPVVQLAALHRQCSQQARQESNFDVGGKTDFLDWEAVQRVRLAAEKALGAVKTKAAKLKLTRDVTVLRLLADQPPDRVGVIRTLRLGGSLKRKPDGSYELDLSEPGAHKTSSIFGATRTSINASISPWLDRYIESADIPADGFLFHARGDTRVVITPSAWSKCVKATFARHGDIALCPKDARASFITFLRGGDHDDETVKAAAIAMRHSSKIQASATYDKGGSDRRVSAAMKVASDFSAKFSSADAQ